MTTPIDPTRRVGPPTAAEIAALTARLRNLSARGRDVDPAERAAFLADKDALLARIPASHTDTDAEATGPRGLEMPRWIREHAARAEAELNTGIAAALPADDPQVVAQRFNATGTTRGERTAAAGAPPSTRWSEEERREQLTRWHTDDTVADLDATTDAPTMFSDQERDTR